MKIILLILLSLNLYAYKYGPVADQQIDILRELDSSALDENITLQLLDKQESIYLNAIIKIVQNRDMIDSLIKRDKKRLFSLKQRIRLNKKYGNNYAVLRDEVRRLSLHLMLKQDELISVMLHSLDTDKLNVFKNKLATLFGTNQLEIQDYIIDDYDKYLKEKGDSQTLKELQTSIEDYKYLQIINSDILKFLAIFQEKMFRLNTYKRLHLLEFNIWLHTISFTDPLDVKLKDYGLNTMKIILIITISFLIFIFRRTGLYFISIMAKQIFKIESHFEELIQNITKILNIILIFFSFETALWIYYDFSLIPIVSSGFGSLYAILITVLVYRAANNIAYIKLKTYSGSANSPRREVINVGIKIANFIIIILGMLATLHFLGANLSAILGGLGIGGLAVAFAARETLANFFGTISIIASDLFSQGDWIEVNGNSGVIVEVGLRVTTLRTFDNALISIPNSIIANTEVKNWQKRRLGRRIKMYIGVKYDSKMEDILIAVNEIKEMMFKHKGIATNTTKFETEANKSAKLVSREDSQGIKKTLMVFVDEYAASSINILVYGFSKSVDWEEYLSVKQEVMVEIAKILEKNNLEFAFNSLSIYNENIEK